ncbi:hypothetical protein [Pseudoduganella namucuonensis]|uniref:Alpha/beta hydrolase n=1 Tax=Pseudoduganella namucuonensis TaxID=1035707 RepID=A0A1I7JVP5_9BURK|nr:hypothetical protein [Pseudoduganella namucuonensis]SFU89278.1 hypothetical protein SAMN05216552_101375 [Pseudoduganella namucuonensis]
MIKLTVLPLLLSLSACTTPYHPPRFMEADARFPGLIDFVREAPARTVDVMLVHGMCTHDARWAADTVRTLATALAANTAPAPARAAETGTGIEIIPATVRTPQGEIRFQSLIWSPLTTPLKTQLCYDQTDKSPICQGSEPFQPRRASLNARLKDLLLDDCLADAMIYQGAARGEIQRQMREAILRATAQTEQSAQSGPPAPLVVISESLGSKILFDTLNDMLDEPAASHAAAAAQRTVDRLGYLNMAANQIPTLALADQRLPSPGALAVTAHDSLQRLLLRRRGPALRAAGLARLTVVAYTDPNDLLSYTLERERYARKDVEVFNVLVSNAGTWFGAFERPDLAHLRYLENPDVAGLIGCGQPRSAACR